MHSQTFVINERFMDHWTHRVRVQFIQRMCRCIYPPFRMDTVALSHVDARIVALKPVMRK